ncbi:MAG TPA: Wzz/FepE/Etk N-terminal domain-containing protein [Candidatus Eisenbacteria bacterium]|nr:Wzz/FepE/Etk N-terminal domain-containing protein [Candidatus Eisenbacteria bacterium]
MDDRPPFTLLDALAHRRQIILVITGVCCLAAAALSVFLPKTYEATAIVYLDTARTATDFDSGIAAGDLLQHDFIVSATSRSTLVEACALAGNACTSSDLVAPETTIGKLVSAAVYRGTSELTVSAKASSPAQAAALANAVAQAMINQDSAEVTRLYKPARDNLNKEIAQLAAAMDTERKALANSPPGSSAAAGHQAELTRLQNAYMLDLTRVTDLNVRMDRLTNIANIVQPALPPAKAESPNPVLYISAALVAGLCIGVFAALLIHRFDDRIVSADGLARAAAAPVVFVTPGVLRSLLSPTSGTYSLALANVFARSPAPHSILVVAASERDKSGPVARGLSSAAAGAGQHAAVVELNGSAAIEKHDLESTGDELVLVPVPSPDVNPKALVLGRTIKHSVIVATNGVTRFGDARRTADLLRQSGVDVVAGILVNT